MECMIHHLKKYLVKVKLKEMSLIQYNYVPIMIFLLPFAVLFINGLQIRPVAFQTVSPINLDRYLYWFSWINSFGFTDFSYYPEKPWSLYVFLRSLYIVTVLFIFLVAAMNMIDKALGGIDVNSFSTITLRDCQLTGTRILFINQMTFLLWQH